MLSFLPLDAFPVLHGSLLHSLMFVGLFAFIFVLSEWKTFWTELRWQVTDLARECSIPLPWRTLGSLSQYVLVIGRHHTTDPVPLATKRPRHNTASAMFDRWCSTIQIMSCFFPSSHFIVLIILVQVRFDFICPEGLFQVFFHLFSGKVSSGLPALQCYQRFAHYRKSSVFRFTEASLDGSLWQWHSYLLQSTLNLAWCYERVFCH